MRVLVVMCYKTVLVFARSFCLVVNDAAQRTHEVLLVQFWSDR